MHKNRIIIVLAILIFFVPQSGFFQNTKIFLIEVLSALIAILALMIERKGFFSLQWRKKSTTTPVAKTYVEHKGAVSSTVPVVTPTIDTPKL